MDSTLPTPASPAATGARSLPRWVWLAAGGGLLLISGLASALVFRGSKPAEPESTQVAAASSKVPATASAKAAAPNDGVCASCGVVESVQAVKKKGAGTGAGAVAGGVLGGVVGHQMGGGSGKTAMTVLGAIGGGMAGNEVEKRARSETVYQVHLRMDDGSKRTVTLSNAPVSKGDRVAVDGQNLRRLQGEGSKSASSS